MANNREMLSFPEKNQDDVITTSTPRVIFRSYPWQFLKPALTNFRPDTELNNKDVKNIRLYLPTDLTEDYTASWEQEEVVTALANFGERGSTKTSVTSAIINKFKSEFPGLANSAEYAKGGTNFPGKYLLFNQVSPISIPFSFDLIPHSREESLMINRICEAFKTEILPVYNGNLLNYPNIWRISFKNIIGPGSVERNGSNNMDAEYQSMALTGCKITYMGASNSALVYNSNYPVGVNLSLTFKSIKHMYREGEVIDSNSPAGRVITRDENGYAFNTNILNRNIGHIPLPPTTDRLTTY